MNFSKKFLALTLALFMVVGNLGAAAASAALDAGDEQYTLSEEVVIQENDTPLAGGPTERECCVMHFILMICALGVSVYYVCDRKKRQAREFELRAELR